MKILVANLGSTSLKYRLFDFSGGQERLLTRGGFERLTDHCQGIEDCLAALQKENWIANENDLAAVGFKTVLARHITGCVRLDESVVQSMEAFNIVAPAHNPPYIAGIRMFAKRLPGVPLIGLFETAFYMRRWGFHGASHKFIAERSAELLCREDVAARVRNLYVDNGKSPVREPVLRVISCHLGGSSSVTGIRNGVAIGNSMGFSPQSGVPQNNRVGDIDPFALPYVMRSTGLGLSEAVELMCKESGLKALSGGHNDIRDIVARAEQHDPRAQLALDVYVHNIRHWIGSYFLQLNGLDALVFTAGIGENRAGVREAICRDLNHLGIVLDPKLNAGTGAHETVISAPESPVKIMIIPTNEELVVAREVRRFLQNN